MMWLGEADVILPSATWTAGFSQDHQEQELFLQVQILLSGIWDTLQPDSNSELLTIFQCPWKEPFDPGKIVRMKCIICAPLFGLIYPHSATLLAKCHPYVCYSPNYLYISLLYPMAYLTPLLWCLMSGYSKCDSEFNTTALPGSLLEMQAFRQPQRTTLSKSPFQQRSPSNSYAH